MSVQVNVNWQSQKSFLATNMEGDVVAIDGGSNGSGLGPSELLLAALGGCVSTTIMGVLEKKRQQITSFEIEIVGEKQPDWPKAYTAIHMIYKVSGVDINQAAVERAIELAETRYCTVSASLKAPVTHELVIFSEAPAPA
ncbi:MAG: OsmC family protein [Caldilineales bacterium]|nr:OsmC family protein [Caldilineales bacterium]